MNSTEFFHILSATIEPMLLQWGFGGARRHASGKFYSSEYESARNKVIVSYEPGDRYLSACILHRAARDAPWPSMDDGNDSFRLGHLETLYRDSLRGGVRFNAKELNPSTAEAKRLVRNMERLASVLPPFLAGHPL